MQEGSKDNEKTPTQTGRKQAKSARKPSGISKARNSCAVDGLLKGESVLEVIKEHAAKTSTNDLGIVAEKSLENTFKSINTVSGKLSPSQLLPDNIHSNKP